MKIIKNAKESILQVWGEQKLKDAEYRFYQYVLRTDCEDGTLLYNNVSGELVLLNSKERRWIDSLPGARTEVMSELIKRHFLVPIDYDDKKSVNQLRKIFQKLKQSQNITHYHILPTSNCNARCFYCYENNMPRENMSEKTACKLVEFIEHHCGEKKEVTLDWFGGEPTLGVNRIDQICKELLKKNIKFTSLMISNGYQFSDEMLCKAKELWNLKQIQITLDGTEEIYNKTKAYVNVADNPYVTVLNHIEKLAEQNIHVVIRLNLDCHNEKDLEVLIDELSRRFRGNKYINVYVAIIHENLGSAPILHEVSDNRFLEMRWNELRSRLERVGLRHSKDKLPKLESDFCMAGDDTTVLITPSGDISKCEHKIYDSVVGNLDFGITLLEETRQWKKEKTWDRCFDCVLYPNCYFLENCSIARKCTDTSIERGILKYEMLMKKSYYDYKQRGK